ncbi:UNVERIFIED_ORG: alkylated DNA nucleotide flippase Atl1 [Pseudomonas reinekei]|nr:alkylated DNA nucleotide flippase Atl1 [Pseudomonas reinekei]
MTDPTDEPESAAQIRRTALYLTLAQVPEGKVVSYGQLAELAGLGRAARWVGRTLSQLPSRQQAALASRSGRKRAYQPAGGQPFRR